MPDVAAMFAVDLSGEIRSWSHAAATLYGWDAADVLSRPVARVLGGSQPDAVEQAFETARRQGSWSGKLRQTTKSGRAFAATSHWSLVSDALGNPEIVIVAQLRPGASPEEGPAQRYAALSSITAAAAHELKNLFTHLLLYSGILNDQLADSSPQKRAPTRETVAAMASSVRQGIAAARDLMLVCEGDAGEAVPVSLKLILSQLQKLGEERFPGHTVVATDHPHELWTVEVDLTRIYDVLWRLCQEAATVLPDGGTVLVQAANQPATGGAPEPKAVVALSIAAVGASVDSEAVERLLGPGHPQALNCAPPSLLDEIEDPLPCADCQPPLLRLWRLRLPARLPEP